MEPLCLLHLESTRFPPQELKTTWPGLLQGGVRRRESQQPYTPVIDARFGKEKKKKRLELPDEQHGKCSQSQLPPNGRESNDITRPSYLHDGDGGRLRWFITPRNTRVNGREQV